MKNIWIFDEGRLAILRKLFRCYAAPGCDLRSCLKMKKPLLSHHIKLLREGGIIEERKDGREKYYRIVPEKRHFVRKILKIVG